MKVYRTKKNNAATAKPTSVKKPKIAVSETKKAADAKQTAVSEQG